MCTHTNVSRCGRQAILKTVALVALLLPLSIRCQTLPVSQLPASPSPLVVITAASPANLPLLDKAVVAKFHPNAFILANNSEHAIVGLMVQWTSDGHPHNVHSDSFMQVTNSPVVLPHARLLVAPGAFVNEANIGKQHIGVSVDKMDAASTRKS